jgi:hypothetical protein
MKRVIFFDFDSDVLHPESELKSWVQSFGNCAEAEVGTSSGSLVVVGDEGIVDVLVEKLDAREGPEHLLWALVPDGDGEVRRVRGGGFASYRERLATAKGRTTRLNAMPEELGERYWQSMTSPDYARVD